MFDYFIKEQIKAISPKTYFSDMVKEHGKECALVPANEDTQLKEIEKLLISYNIKYKKRYMYKYGLIRLREHFTVEKSRNKTSKKF